MIGSPLSVAAHSDHLDALRWAGSEELFHQAQPLFDVMGKASFLLGEVTPGQCLAN